MAENNLDTINAPIYDDDFSDDFNLGESIMEFISSSEPTPILLQRVYVPRGEEKAKTKSKTKTKKKKKKKKSVIDDIDFGDMIIEDKEEKNVKSVIDEEDEYVKSYRNEEENDDYKYDVYIMDGDDLIPEYDEDEEMNGIITDQKRSYRKNKESEGYQNQFAEELSLLYGLLGEVNQFGSDLDKMYKSLSSSKTRGMSKYTTDLVNSILSTKQAKLSVLKEISGVKKTIADLNLKQSKSTGAGEEGAGVNGLAASYLSNIIKHGRKEFVQSLGGGNEPEIQYESQGNLNEFMAKMEEEYMGDDAINEEIMASLSNSQRSHNADLYISNENRDVTIKVRHDISSGDWEFVAIDKEGLEVFDYPFPDKEMVSPVKFTADGDYCTDKYGRSYAVIEDL